MKVQSEHNIITVIKDYINIMFNFVPGGDEEYIKDTQRDIKRNISILKELGLDTSELELDYKITFEQ